MLTPHGFKDVSVLLAMGVPDAQREAASRREAQLGLKLEAGRLGRAEMMMRQKVMGSWEIIEMTVV